MATLLPGIKEFAAGRPLHNSPVTVRMLLQHTSGLRDYVEGEINGEEVIDILVEKPLGPLDPRDLVTASVNMGSAGIPGDAFAYSNTNYILLGY